MIKQGLVILLILGIAFFSEAQEPEMQQTIEDLLESEGEITSDDLNFQEILDDLESYRQNPIQINQATSDELNRLHLLSELQIHNLLSYREKTGTLLSIYEMASIDGFTPDLLQKIKPFITFKDQGETYRAKRSSGYLFVKSIRTFPKDIQSGYEGSPERYYLRLKQTTDLYEYGLVAEKDPREAFFSQSNRQGFDYMSGYANFRIGKKGGQLFVGDYHISFGQGLVAWQGFSIGKSAEASRIFKSGPGIRSYSSTDENLFFRGLASQFTYGHFSFYPFISTRQLDAHVDTLNNMPFFSAFQTSGYHRTISEIASENSLNQLVEGGHVSYASNRWSFGLTSVYTRFDAEMKRGDEPYDRFLPEGKENTVAGIDWKGTVNDVFLFGEVALSANSGKALLAGCMLKPAPNAELSMLYRNINKTYFSYFSNAFTESSRVNDEHALYLGFKFYPAPGWIINVYSDVFRFEWIKYTTAAPSSGTEFFAQAAYNPTLYTHFYLRFFQEDKELRQITGNLNYNDLQRINRIRFNFTYDLNQRFSIKSRFEFSYYSKQGSERGLLICQDVFYKPIDKPFKLNGRIAYFNTEGYDSRIYSYENDLLYSFSIPALYGNGIRSYLNIQHKLSDKFTLWLKLATLFPFARLESQQTDDSRTRYEIKIQIRYQF